MRINKDLSPTSTYTKLMTSNTSLKKTQISLSSGTNYTDTASISDIGKARAQADNYFKAAESNLAQATGGQSATSASQEGQSILDKLKAMASQSSTTAHTTDASAEFETGTGQLFNSEDIQLYGSDSATETNNSSVAEASSAVIANVNSKAAEAADKLVKDIAKMDKLQANIDKGIGATDANMSITSRVRDVDMAKELLDFTKTNILNQAATAMQAQTYSMSENSGIMLLLR